MSHISYSELKTWAECPFKHKLSYIDRIRRFIGNEYTAFGRTVHALCENAVQGTLDERDYDDFFDEYFDRELDQLGEEHQRREHDLFSTLCSLRCFPLVLYVGVDGISNNVYTPKFQRNQQKKRSRQHIVYVEFLFSTLEKNPY